MARPIAVLPDRGVLLTLIDGEGRVTVRATPGAKIEELEISGGRLLAKVRVKPEDGKANEAVRKLLSSAFGVAPSRVELLRGATAREKQFRIAL